MAGATDVMAPGRLGTKGMLHKEGCLGQGKDRQLSSRHLRKAAACLLDKSALPLPFAACPLYQVLPFAACPLYQALPFAACPLYRVLPFEACPFVSNSALCNLPFVPSSAFCSLPLISNSVYFNSETSSLHLGKVKTRFYIVEMF